MRKHASTPPLLTSGRGPPSHLPTFVPSSNRSGGELLDAVRVRLGFPAKEDPGLADLFTVAKFVRDVANVFGRPHTIQTQVKDFATKSIEEYARWAQIPLHT